jgi:AcrR family transcriptional regulator
MEATRTRKSAEERREEILAVAMRHFAIGGYHGTSTEGIAREAGISQPYLFRLFGTKRELFLACAQACHEAIRDTFERAAEDASREERFAAMGTAYVELLADRRLLRFQLQSYAACSDPVIQERIRSNYRKLVMLVTQLSGGAPEEVWTFFAKGMLLNVIASLDLHSITDEDEWAREWTKATEMTA